MPLSRSQVSLVAILVILFGLFLPYYLWTASSSGFPFRFSAEDHSYYNLLARGFLSGHLYLPVDPPPQLLALPDPFDPAQNAAYRLHDASLYKGKYYFYFGPTPVVLLFAPFYSVTGLYFPESLAIALFAFGGLLLACLLLWHLIQWFLPETPRWQLILAVLCLGFCNYAPVLLRRPDVYEAAISCGYCAFLGAAYCFATGILRPGLPCRWRMGWGSFLLGLAAGSRIFLIIPGGLVLALACWLLLRSLNSGKSSLRWTAEGVAGLALPFGGVIFLLGLYNRLRFDSWVQFGLQYQLAAIKTGNFQLFDLRRVPYDFYFYALHGPKLDHVFPFFHANGQGPFRFPSEYFGGAWVEPVVGFLSGAPVTYLLFLTPLLLPKLAEARRGAVQVVMLAMAVGLVIVMFLSGAANPTMRYLVDYSTFLLLASVLVWFLGAEFLREKRSRLLIPFHICVVGAIGYGMVAIAAMSLTGYYDLLRGSQPATYARIREVFAPVERMLGGTPQIDQQPGGQPIGASAMTMQQMSEQVQEGKASRCTVVTVPAGAELEVGGVKLGVTPVSLMFFQKGAGKRTLTLRLAGYKTVTKEVVPDGKDLRLEVTLEKQ